VARTRRVRLIEDDGRIVARRGGSKAPRIAFPKDANGVTGDPWAPIDQRKAAAKVLTIDGSGFHYRRVADLLDPQQIMPAPLQRWRQDDGSQGLSLVLTATVRGHGGTDGFHERRIPVPPSAVPWFGGRTDALASLAKSRIQDTSAIRLKVLRTALYVLFQNAPDKLNFSHTASKTKADPFLATFDRAVDRGFFEALFEELAATEEATKNAARQKWLRDLKTLGALQLEAAKAGTPRSGIRRYQAEAAADTAFELAFRKQFPAAVEHDQ
jgi:CRISPR system Cascade subunit CasA